ncbi:histidine phosphatase family protein [Pseudonocardia asaccharolytica]|uniref:Phosphoglycerate mutase n=1 Tax=Pseudonocardia asaccharolytica DSM 44247 = NBRC 16224 TaxID=1123024 RepID=A0A511CV61_9PSEU|nr:histidine phosphatase family protein [Pseudonocardia asaccharolytica]GEL16462.1 phosphoglycerate mutase [Pseudonocardia asaccharolytica DSM 44247 = NBRC 16224]
MRDEQDAGIDGLRLVLVRHGQTDANVRRELDTVPPGSPLNALGLRQAVSVAEVLAGWPVRAVYASRAIRAQQTAAPVAATHRLGVTVLDGVHEVLVGELEGRSDLPARTAFDEVYDAWWGGDLDRRLPGGESALDLRARFLPAVDRIVARSNGERGAVVLVSHGAAIRLAAAALLGELAETQYVPNTGRVVLAHDPGAPTGWSLSHWDSGPPLIGDVTAGAAPA